MTRKDEIYDNRYYKKFLVEKNKIKERYPKEIFQTHITSNKGYPFTEEHQLLFKQYIKEIGDLMFKPKGWFQKFTWDIMSDSEKNEMERRTRANNQGNRQTEFNYY